MKYCFYDTIREAVESCHDWQSLRTALKAKGIRVEIVRRAGGSGRTGIVFNDGKITFSGGQIDRSLTYSRISQAMGVTEQTAAADTSMHVQSSDSLDRPSVSFSHTGKDNSGTDATGAAENKLQDSTDGLSITGNIGEAAVEIIMQPHDVQTIGGGGSSDLGWRDDDKEKEKNDRPYKRRR